MSESTQTLTLTDFLLARIAEDEAQVRLTEQAMASHDWGADPGLPAIDRGVNRIRAECEAKRRIMEERQWHLDHAARAVASYDSMRQAERACKYLAAVYADHPDYREEWRP